MHRLIVTTLLLASACGGGKKHPEEPKTDTALDAGAATAETATDAGAEKKDECVGFDISDLDTMLSKSVCEETAKPDNVPNADLKGKLEVTVSAQPTKVAPGAKADLVVTFTNKTKEPMTLHFRLDPLPRYEVEAFDKKGKRVDLPTAKEPPPPAGVKQASASEPKSAKITIAANGSARTRLAWDAQKMKWAPEKYKGTPPERGFPRVPAGPLPKGKYTVKVLTPLIGVFEAGDEKLSAPKVEIEIGG